MVASRGKRFLLGLSAFALAILAGSLTIWAYAPALEAPFSLDDGRNIVDSPALRWEEVSFKNIKRVLDISLLQSRPIANLSFALNHWASGMEPAAFRGTNILIHLTVGMVLLWLCVLYVNISGGRSAPDNSRIVTVLLAMGPVLIFLLHPLNTQAVTYIVQRMASLAALFTLVSLSCYIAGRGKAGPRARLWYLASASAFLLAFGTKENAIMLIPVVAVFELCFFRHAWREKVEAAFGFTWTRRWTIRTCVGAVVLIAMAVMAVGYYSEATGLLTTFPNRDFSGLERMLTQARVQLFHLSQLFWPAPGRLNLDHEFAISRGMLSPSSTLPAVLACIAALAFSTFLALRHARYGFPLLAYAIFHALEAGPVNLEIIFEHRMYLPMTMLVVLGATLVVDAGRYRQILVFPILIAIGGGLSNWTHARNEVWADPIGFQRDIAQKSPNKVRAQFNYANALANDGRADQALPVIERAVDLDPLEARSHGLLGQVLMALGRHDEALAAYGKAIGIDPSNVTSLTGLGEALQAAGRDDAAMQHFIDSGARLAQAGRPWEAILILQEGAKRFPESAATRSLLGNAYMLAGMQDKAIVHFGAAVEMDATLYEAWYNLGLAAEALGRRDEAIRAYEGFLRTAPSVLRRPIATARERITALSSVTSE
jgi:tetratricopeptide (TPR) repeat protein